MFFIYEKARSGPGRLLAQSEYLDVAEHCARGICEWRWPSKNQHLDGFREEGDCFIEVRNEEDKVITSLVLRRGRQMEWMREEGAK